MKNKLVFASGMAVGYVLGTRAGRESYEKLKVKADELWNSPKVQGTVSEATGVLKEKMPAVQEQTSGAVKKAQDRLSGVLHRDKENGGGSGETPTASGTGPTGGNPAIVEEPPFTGQSGETRPNLGS